MYSQLLKSTEFYKRRYHNFATVLIIPVFCLLIFVATFLVVAKKEITVKSSGEITPKTVVEVIQSTGNSRVTTNNLTNNQEVREGDLLLQYDEDATPQRKEEQEKIISKQEESSKSKASKKSKKDKKKTKKTKDKKATKNKVDSDKLAVFASEDGVVHMNSKFEGANFLPQGQEIAQIYPKIEKNKKVQVTYYVDSDSVSLMKPKKDMRFSLEKKGHQKVTLKGKIKTVASAAVTTKNGNLFKITAEVKLSKKEASWVKYGMTGNVTTIVDKKTFFDDYKDKLLKNW